MMAATIGSIVVQPLNTLKILAALMLLMLNS